MKGVEGWRGGGRGIAKALTVSFLAIAAFLSFPDIAHACPVCFDANGEVRLAFIVTTGFLTFLPLLMVAAVFFWAKKKFQEMDGEAES